MKNTLLFCLSFCFLALLTACGTQKVKVPDPVVAPQKETVVIPPELLIPCDPLSKLTQKTYAQGEVVEKIAQPWSTIHDACVKKDKALADLVRKAFNIPPVLNQNPSQ